MVVMEQLFLKTRRNRRLCTTSLDPMLFSTVVLFCEASYGSISSQVDGFARSCLPGSSGPRCGYRHDKQRYWSGERERERERESESLRVRVGECESASASQRVRVCECEFASASLRVRVCECEGFLF